MRNLLISMHCITCFMALDHLSCCKCLLVDVTFIILIEVLMGLELLQKYSKL